MKKISIYGIIALISISPLFRGLLFKYETYAFLAGISLLSFLYFVNKVRNDESIHINKLFTALLIVLVMANLLSFAGAVNPRENLDSLLLYTVLCILFTVMYDYFYNDKQHFMKIIMLMLIPTGLACVIAGMEALTGAYDFLNVTLFQERLGSTFQYTNTAAIFFAICFLFSLTLTITLKRRLLRGLTAGAGNLFIFALFLTGSRGGYLTAMAAITLFLVMQPSEYRLKGIANLISIILPLVITFNRFSSSAADKDYIASLVWIAVSFLFATVLYYLFYLVETIVNKLVFKGRAIKIPKVSGYIFAAVIAATVFAVVIFRRQFLSLLPEVLSSRLGKMNLNDPNILFRLEFDKDALKLIAVNWLTGLGGGGWLATYQSVQDVNYIANFTHNNYLQIFIETGILGFLSYTAIITATLLYAFVSFIKAKERILLVYISGLLSSFAALAFHASFDFDLTYISLTLIFWVMIAALATNLSAEQNWRWTIDLRKQTFKVIPVLICAVLISTYALFFAGAYNDNEGGKYAKTGDYRTAMLYYEEANRLDPRNSVYIFELSKIYYYFAGIAKNEDQKELWLRKAESAGEAGANLNRYYPPQLKTLIRICRDQEMPEKYLKYSKELVLSQRCNIENYELLAVCYLDAAKYFEGRNDTEKERQILIECIALQDDPLFQNAKEGKGFDMLKKRLDISYMPSEQLNDYFNKAEDILKKLG